MDGELKQVLCKEGLEWSQPTSLVPLHLGAQRQQHQVRKGYGLGHGKSLLARN